MSYETIVELPPVRDLHVIAADMFSVANQCGEEDMPTKVKNTKGLLSKLFEKTCVFLDDRDKPGAVQGIENAERKTRSALAGLSTDPEIKNDGPLSTLVGTVRDCFEEFIGHPAIEAAKTGLTRLTQLFEKVAPPESVDEILYTYANDRPDVAFEGVRQLKSLDEETRIAESDKVIEGLRSGEAWAKRFVQIVRHTPSL